MKVIKFTEEANRLNVSIYEIRNIYKRTLREEKIHGIIIPNKDEIIRFNPSELEIFVDSLKNKHVSLEIIASELNFLTYQAFFLIDYLLQIGKLRGILTTDWIFISKFKIIELMIDELERTGKINTVELSNKLKTNKESIDLFLNEISKQIMEEVTPYGKIDFEDLANEVKLPSKLVLYLVKNLILERKIDGQIDKVDNVLIINTTTSKSSSTEKVEFRENQLLKRHRSDWWYLVPIVFGLFGGIIGYVIFERDNPEAAGYLFWVGVISSLLSFLVLYLYWSWIISLFR